MELSFVAPGTQTHRYALKLAGLPETTPPIDPAWIDDALTTAVRVFDAHRVHFADAYFAYRARDAAQHPHRTEHGPARRRVLPIRFRAEGAVLARQGSLQRPGGASDGDGSAVQDGMLRTIPLLLMLTACVPVEPAPRCARRTAGRRQAGGVGRAAAGEGRGPVGRAGADGPGRPAGPDGGLRGRRPLRRA